ncbi:hypothetical protein MKX47_15725 [Solibacillus sp. FSL R7-0668]|uniref:hypothetical protein n=1 Tax=Solibacillus sp. FSL R7-0668 TaxID=2921688 RepID=UPI0030F9CFD3
MQRSAEQARELLVKMHNEFNLIEPRGRGKGRYYTLTRYTYDILEENMKYERQQSLDKEAIKIRLLTVLKNRPLANKEIRQMTGMDRKQVHRLMQEMAADGVVAIGKGSGTKYTVQS